MQRRLLSISKLQNLLMINVHDMLIIYVNVAENSDIFIRKVKKYTKKTRIILTIWEEDHIKSCIYYNGFIVTALGRLFNTSAHSKMFDQIFQRNQQQNMSNKTANALHLNAPS